ncbi:alpha/beta fold hydrolase [Oxalobacteraceae bacterium OM1]|nr:alpha/beta fold hydrolase [Oxalobacteraceae bacterium OM1]
MRIPLPEHSSPFPAQPVFRRGPPMREATLPSLSGMRFCFESLDAARRQRGEALDRMGFGPAASPSTILLDTPALRLHAYDAEPAGLPALIVPAPIKRHYIWDLAPGSSVVRHAVNEGLRPFVIEWKDPAGEVNALGLDDYGARLIDACMDAIAARTGKPAAFLFAHSLGGVFATTYAAWRPTRTAGLVLIETPLHFGADTGAFRSLLAMTPPAQQITRSFSSVPGSLLSMASMAASPTTFALERYADLMASLPSRERLQRHLQVERWTLDEAPMARRLFEEVIDKLYRGDELYCGRLTVADTTAGPDKILCPMLSVVDPHSRVIPPASILAFQEAAASPRKQVLEVTNDQGVGLAHVGALIGSNAHRRLWPQIFAWVRETGMPAAA